jgi:hypothetical protein
MWELEGHLGHFFISILILEVRMLPIGRIIAFVQAGEQHMWDEE